MEESLILLKEKFHLKETDANQYSPLVLAYLGDAVYEILIRTIVVREICRSISCTKNLRLS